MTETLRSRLLSINKQKPFVWQLHLTEDEYLQLKNYVSTCSSFSNSDNAALAMIFIAEWYKRDYDGRVKNPLSNVSAADLWRISGFNSQSFVYETENTKRHLESALMLGGLPMRFILQQNRSKLLKSLCRIYKGDKSSLEDDLSLGSGQAVAFQESIRQRASIYGFLKTLLLGKESDVFADEDLRNKLSLTNQFIKAVKSAYDEVMRDKFRLEWIFNYNPSSPYLYRMLRLNLRPEELGGFHQYLRFERASSWGSPDLMKQRVLRVSLQFLNGGNLVGNDDTRRTIMTFENSGQDDTGFEAVGLQPWSILRSLPTDPFNRINVIITDDSGKQYNVQHFDCNMQFLQLWQMSDGTGYWSSTCNNQSDSAVVYSNNYTLSGAEPISKPFYDKTNGISEPWNFAFISDNVILHHNGDDDITLWNREGYIRFAPKLYTDVLRYNNGMVRYVFNDDSDISEDSVLYPAIFRRSDITALHFASRNTISAQPDCVEIQYIGFKQFNAPDQDKYQEWTDDNNPEYGRIKLRLTIKGIDKIYSVLYLPSMLEHNQNLPVIRDFDNGKIKYVNSLKQIDEILVNVPKDKKPLDITVPLTVFRDECGYVELDAILPTLIKEIYLDGKISRYLKDEENFVLPYLLKDRIAIRDFNRNGYSEYECFNVGVLEERGSHDQWKRGVGLTTVNVSAKIPDYIKVAYGLPEGKGKVAKLVYWDYSTEKSPMEVDSFFNQMDNYSILFQDMRHVDDNLECIPPVTRNEWTLNDDDWNSAWNLDDVKNIDDKKQDAVLLRCYDIATMYKTYYFIFNPLFNMSKDSFIRGICIPLKNRNNNSLSETDMQNLMRCATECGLNWNELSKKI